MDIVKKVLIIKGYRDLERTYINACEEIGVKYDVLDVFGESTWLHKVNADDYELAFVRPPCDTVEARYFFSDVIQILLDRNIRVYPQSSTLNYYENKRYFHYISSIYDVNTPRSEVVHKFEDLITVADDFGLPLVIKTVVGSGSAGVKIIKNKNKLKRVGRKIFGYHPAFASGLIPSVKVKNKIKIPAFGRSAKHACLIQEKVDFKWEWRIILIGDAIFGYRKLKDENGFASGSKLYGYGLPSKELLDVASGDAKKLNFDSGALDYFELADGSFTLNEAQALFGSKPINKTYPDAQMFDEKGQPCIFLRENGGYKLHYGSFCQNECANLRVKHALKLSLVD